SVAVATTETLSEFRSVTYARVPSGVTATPYGSAPAATLAIRRPVAALSTHSVPAPGLVTYRVEPSGLTAMPCGPEGSGMDLMTFPAAVSMTEMPRSVVT